MRECVEKSQVQYGVTKWGKMSEVKGEWSGSKDLGEEFGERIE